MSQCLKEKLAFRILNHSVGENHQKNVTRMKSEISTENRSTLRITANSCFWVFFTVNCTFETKIHVSQTLSVKSWAVTPVTLIIHGKSHQGQTSN